MTLAGVSRDTAARDPNKCPKTSAFFQREEKERKKLKMHATFGDS